MPVTLNVMGFGLGAHGGLLSVEVCEAHKYGFENRLGKVKIVALKNTKE